ncbi:S53 family peptidase [Gandjariella thermophila]|uniref:Peptidase S8 n=1 Tax=Gandjariella thermophila TaxID=1931992 RepID=A0A4D4IXW1_9PSEU|nr:S53 family peptidase [Gandjariella thermophila]GDY29061.1 peptidase S8 [Gandjariella thermophila]
MAPARGRRRRALRALATSLLAAATIVPLSALTAPSAAASSPAVATTLAGVPLLSGSSANLPCGTSRGPGQAHCLGKMMVSPHGSGPLLVSTPTGYGPAEIRSAYKLSGASSGGRTVAIVDAYDDPNAEADLAVYRKARGLPPCTTANGCFRKVNQNGQAAPLPAGDYGWAMEISLDLDAVSATCPDCHILLVEANSADSDPLMKAVDTAAATPGVVAISNSYGGNEDNTIIGLDAHLNHPGVAITASSGDSGYGVSWPASSRYVTAVGGTSLSQSSGTSRGWTETVWSGTGSGCSAYEAKPSWQHDTGCARRTVADVAAVADPRTGLGVYDTYNNCGSSSFCDLLIQLGIAQGADGWIQVGGTSLSSPVIASVYALAGNTASITAASYPYQHSTALFDVTSGANGRCSPAYLCTAGPGYDGPTGLGTPNGTGAF